jgi:hypothetical protein
MARIYPGQRADWQAIFCEAVLSMPFVNPEAVTEQGPRTDSTVTPGRHREAARRMNNGLEDAGRILFR